MQSPWGKNVLGMLEKSRRLEQGEWAGRVSWEVVTWPPCVGVSVHLVPSQCPSHHTQHGRQHNGRAPGALVTPFAQTVRSWEELNRLDLVRKPMWISRTQGSHSPGT